MNARFSKLLLSVVLIAALIVPALAILSSAGAQEEAATVARVRIGYFAFDPREFDTFIDGKPAPFGASWEKAGWLAWTHPDPSYSYIVCCVTTPFIDFSSGVHSFAFAPKGAGLDAAIFGPQEVTFEAGHVYSLAIVGEMDDHSLNVLVIDETEVFSEADLRADFMIIAVHDLKGAPSVDTRVTPSEQTTGLEYGQFTTGWWPGGSIVSIHVSSVGDQPTTLLSFTTVPVPAGISDLEAYIGSYPGERGKDYFFAFNWGYPGEITVIDGGTVAVGDTVAGKIAEVAQRVKYSLTLEADMVLNIYANATGTSTAGYGSGGMFDPSLYVYDAQGNLLWWNYELSWEDDIAGKYDAGLEGITLTAGVYPIEVGSGNDLTSGPYELIVQNAASD
jgi:hypothetical protein